MSSDPLLPTLADLDFEPYLDATGRLPAQYEGKIGVFAIYSETQDLQYVGYSRNVLLSLKQHLVRQPQQCHWVKVATIARPSRSLLEDLRAAWIAENGSQPLGNGAHQAQWEQDIDVKAAMTPDELAQSQNPALEERAQIKVIKQAARRVEGEILTVLEGRGCQESLRFNPKLKETGLLSLK